MSINGDLLCKLSFFSPLLPFSHISVWNRSNWFVRIPKYAFFTKFIRFLFNYACLLTFNILQFIDQYICLTNHHSCSNSNSSYLNSFHMYVVQLENHGQPACNQQHASVGCVLSDVLGSRQCIKVTSATENSCSSYYKCASQFGPSAERYTKQR